MNLESQPNSEGKEVLNKEEENKQVKMETPSSLLESAIKNIEQTGENDSSTEILKQTFQDTLKTLESDGETTKEEQELNIFIAYQGLKEVEQYVDEEDRSKLDEIKNSLTQKIQESSGIDLEGEEIGEMEDLDEKLKESKKILEKFATEGTPNSPEETSAQQEEFEKYFSLKQEISKRQQEVLGKQESFYKQYAEKVSGFFEGIGAKVDNWTLGNKLTNFIGEHKLASKTMKTATAGLLAFGALGAIDLFNPDTSEAAETNDQEKNDFVTMMKARGMSEEDAQKVYESQMAKINSFNQENVGNTIEDSIIKGEIELKIGNEKNIHVNERSQEQGELDFVKGARTNSVEYGYYYSNGNWSAASNTIEGNAIDVDKNFLNKSLEKLKQVNDSQGESTKEIYHYHIHPASVALFEKFGEIGEIRPVPPSLADIDFYAKQENALEKDGVEFKGKVADLTGVWTINSVDLEKMGQIFLEKVRAGEASNRDDLYAPIINKYIFGKEFKLENIDEFTKEMKTLGIDLEYKATEKDALNDRKKGLKNLTEEYLKTNDLNKDKLPPNLSSYFKKILG